MKKSSTQDKKSWYAVITAETLYDSNLSARQKLLLAILSNLANDKGYSFASNETLAKFINASTRTIQRDLSFLEENIYIGRIVKLKKDFTVEFRGITLTNLSTKERIHQVEALKNTPTTTSHPPRQPVTPPVTTGHPPRDTGGTIITKDNNKGNNKE